MSGLRTIFGRKQAGAVGLLLVAGWLLLPMFHRLLEVRRDAHRAHDESNCPVCVAAYHAAAPGPALAVRPMVAIIGMANLTPATEAFILTPNVRATGPRGPPSSA